MKEPKITTIPWLLLLLAVAAGSNAQAEEGFAYGQIVDSVQTTTNPNESYALYLPSCYSPDSVWPVIFFFDPAARGAYPLELYSKIAEQEGIVLAASNQSRNYLSWNEIHAIANRMIADMELKFSIDSTRRYTCGFSGGSRVAAKVALVEKMTGIIGCGAGFPLPLEIPDTAAELIYSGIVGTRDMNYQEMFELDKELKKREIPAFIITSRYGHTWAPDTLFYEAWRWQQLFYWRNFETHKSEQNFTSLLTKICQSQLELINQGYFLEAVKHYYTLKHHFPDREELYVLTQKIEDIEASKTYKKQLSEAEKYQTRERIVQKDLYRKMSQLRNAINLDDSLQNYWLNTINSYQRMQQSRKHLKADYASRQLNLIAALCSEYIQELSNLPQEKRLLFFSKLWVRASPENWYAHVYLARAYALNKQENQALKNLKISIDLGFDNREWLLKDDAFAPYHKNAAFKELLEAM